MIRPILTAFIEYFLAYIVFRSGKVHKNLFTLILFLLATYQVGEVVIFMTGGDLIGFKIAYIATTLLPPLGVLLVQKLLKKQLGFIFFQLISIGFALFILISPQVAVQFEIREYCIGITEYNPILANYWLYYYQGTLMYTMAFLLYGILRTRDQIQKRMLQMILLGYFSFDGLTMLLVTINPWFGPSSASLMCALALIASLIFARVSLAENFKGFGLFGKQYRDFWKH